MGDRHNQADFKWGTAVPAQEQVRERLQTRQEPFLNRQMNIGVGKNIRV
jgi:hypothetical protein